VHSRPASLPSAAHRSLIGPSLALVVAPTTLAVATQQGTVEARGAVSLVLQKAAGGWKIVHEHYSTRPQAPATPP
jgi:ketosteroid isomerase-like protein